VSGGEQHPEGVHEPIVDWHRVARRVGVTASALVLLAVAWWLVRGLTGRGLALPDLFEALGVALLVMFLAEVVLVGGAAVRGMVRAGERGERLASSDVGILPPQVARRLRRRG
jgi:hypothetical protein